MNTTKHELKKFRDTVEQSDNIIVITDTQQTITYVNEAFTTTTGYTAKEAIGQKPSILNSGKQSKEFYQDLHDTIYDGKKWSGEFINVDKHGNLSYEKASIMPVLDDEGEIKEFIAIKLDGTKEVLIRQELEYSKNEIMLINQTLEQRVQEEVEKNRVQDQKIIQQARLVQMGEMISMIAHQWRQPLSAISATTIDLKIQLDLEVYDFESEKGRDECLSEINKGLSHIEGFTQNLTQTINDFRDFYKQNKSALNLPITEPVRKALSIIKTSLITSNIKIVEDYQALTNIEFFNSELMQVILNILKNAQDNFQEKEHKKALIWISSFEDDDSVTLSISDNGGGIDETILSNIFDPYFSTKKDKNGTGLGLYMSKMIIETHHKGKLLVKNTHKGVCFTINIPKGKLS